MSYPGGKSGSGVYHRLAREIPPHDERLVPFGGRCAITRMVRPAAVNVVVEIDPAVLDQWTDDERRRFDLRLGDGLSFLQLYFGLNRWPRVAPELSMAQVLAAVYRGRSIVESCYPSTTLSERPSTVPFVFVDPPYPEETCTSGSPYRFRFTTEQHQELLHTIKRIPALVMIVSYPNELYERELAGWRTFRYRAFTRRGTRTEQAWCNYPVPRVLHDWRFAGSNRREREKIARRVRNWRRNYTKHPPAERAAIMAELLDAEHEATRYASQLAGICTRCLTVNPSDVVDCSVCRHRGRRVLGARVFDDPCLQVDPPKLAPVSDQRSGKKPTAAPPRKAAAAAKRKAK